MGDTSAAVTPVTREVMEQNRNTPPAAGRRELPDGAAPVPPTEPLLLHAAEQARAVGGRAPNSGFVPYLTVFVFHYLLRDRMRRSSAGRKPHFFPFWVTSVRSPNE